MNITKQSTQDFKSF